jgi:hypothetical protein
VLHKYERYSRREMSEDAGLRDPRVLLIGLMGNNSLANG